MESLLVTDAVNADVFSGAVSSSGAKADDFVHRFSTKYMDAEIDLYYYSLRFYWNAGAGE